jgi:drug/metabolite transporter (DMT)-like permease
MHPLRALHLPQGVGGFGPGTLVAALAAVLFAVGAVLQHEAAADSGSSHGADLRRLVTRPRWIAGQSATATGTLLQVVALGLAPVAIVQPVLAGGLVVALGLRAVRTRRAPGRLEILGAALTVGGLGAFLVAARPAAGFVDRSPGVVPIVVAVAGGALLVGLTARIRRGTMGALACGVAGGIAAGIAAVLISVALKIFSRHGLVHALTSSALWGAVAVAVLAQVGAQQAYSRGPLSWSMPALVLLDPLAAVPVARLLLGERLEPGHAAVWVPAAVVAAIGVVLLSRTGEDVHLPLAIREPPVAPAATSPTASG